MPGDSRRPILCLDFDGVLNSYVSGWKGADVIPDPPVDGAIPFLMTVVASRFDVVIYSSRSHQPGGVSAMRAWLKKHVEEHCDRWHPGDPALPQVVLDAIGFPDHKPSAMVTIDDRAITFTGKWPSMQDLLGFKPWNRK
jgi:hypothetical protein